jgi:peptide/nickel transport system substrate-binding protein
LFDWEGFFLNLGPKANPALRNRFVRQAIVYAIDRRAIANDIARNFMPGVRGIQSVMLLPTAAAYAPNWRMWTYRPRRALALLRSHGCSRGADRIFNCDGQRLSFRVLYRADTPTRQLTFQRIQVQLARIGIDVQADLAPRELWEQRLEKTRDWDLSLFAWAVTPDQTRADFGIFTCKRELNYGDYCNARVSNLMAAAVHEVRLGPRMALLNRADELVARDVPVLPLYVPRGYVLYNGRIRNIRLNPDAADYLVFWNARDWWIAPQ